jgi:phosphoglycolate phosphatase-like HAD superfamily hydrolase
VRTFETPDNWRWRNGPVEPGPAVVFDIDGVLSDAAGRQHFIERGGGRRKDWDAFFEACGDDPLIEEIGRLLELLDPGLQVLLLTGRPIWVQEQTVSWLDRYHLRWDLLVMRDHGDYAAAREFKRWTVEEFRRYGFDLRLAFEDDRRNLEMFRAEGVPCVYIHSGYFDR